ncbi:MAG: DUF3035 domain-containing protein [Pseudomonadota bacterium]
MQIAKGSFKLAVLLGTGLTIAACDRIGDPFEVMSSKRAGPDEFSVIARAPLEMPGSRALPEPTPGTISPLDPDPQRAAIEAVTGGSSTLVSAPGTGISSGEEVLLRSAEVSAASSDIRVQLERDRIEAEENKPFEPPTVLELLSGDDGSGFDEADIIDPNDESRRLQTAGVTAPVNPFEEPPSAERGLNDGPEFEYDFNDRRPNNSLSGNEPEPEPETE